MLCGVILVVIPVNRLGFVRHEMAQELFYLFCIV